MKKKKLLFEKRQIDELKNVLQGIRKKVPWRDGREAIRKLSEFQLIHTATSLQIKAEKFDSDFVIDFMGWYSNMNIQNPAGNFHFAFCASDLTNEVILEIFFKKYPYINENTTQN